MIRLGFALALSLALIACGRDGQTQTGETAKVALPGEALFRQCSACHSIDKGGRNGIGPNLHNVVGRAVASVEGFNYSVALEAKGGIWDAATLDAYLADPRSAVPGNKMAFSGIKNAEDRKVLIDYLSQQK
jgi:cytochrome c